MKPILVIVGLALAAGLTLLGQASGPGSCCGNRPLVDLKGKIARVQITPGEGVPFVIVRIGDHLSTLHLGSIRYLMTQGFNPKVDEDIVAKAYKVGDIFIAATVTLPSQNKTIRLRDESGLPVWRGGPRRGWTQ